MNIKTVIKDYPIAVTAGILGGVSVHVLLNNKWGKIPDLAEKLPGSNHAWELYIGFAGVAGMLAGFAGVVLVFAMTTGSRRFARMRIRGGGRLEANWLSPLLSSFLAAFVSLAAAAADLLGHGAQAAWAFEFVFLVSIHAAMRMCWVLRKLMTATRRQDEEDARPKPVALSDLVAKRKQA